MVTDTSANFTEEGYPFGCVLMLDHWNIFMKRLSTLSQWTGKVLKWQFTVMLCYMLTKKYFNGVRRHLLYIAHWKCNFVFLWHFFLLMCDVQWQASEVLKELLTAVRCSVASLHRYKARYTLQKFCPSVRLSVCLSRLCVVWLMVAPQMCNEIGIYGNSTGMSWNRKYVGIERKRLRENGRNRSVDSRRFSRLIVFSAV